MTRLRLALSTAAFGLAIAALGLVLSPWSERPAVAQSASFDPAQTSEIEAIVRAYLLAHPEIIVEAVTLYEKAQEEQQLAMQQEQIVARRADLVDRATSPVVGNPDGDVTLVEFFDYQCPYCKRMVERMEELMAEDPDLRVVFKEFPILGPNSVIAAKAALAAREQGLYEELHGEMMAHDGQLNEELIHQMAGRVGLDVERLIRDMESPQVLAEIAANLELAQAIGVRGTPAFVIGDQLVPGAVGLEVLQDLIRQQRNG